MKKNRSEELNATTLNAEKIIKINATFNVLNVDSIFVKLLTVHRNDLKCHSIYLPILKYPLYYCAST